MVKSKKLVRGLEMHMACGNFQKKLQRMWETRIKSKDIYKLTKTNMYIEKIYESEIPKFNWKIRVNIQKLKIKNSKYK